MIITIENGIKIEIDEVDLQTVCLFKWRINKDGYPSNSRLGTLHRILLGVPPLGLECDHIDRNKLNNQRSNLRFVSHQENMRNRDLRSDNKTGYKGVMYRSKGPKNKEGYFVSIKLDGYEIGLGRFDTLEQAIFIRKQAEEKYWK